eukprot:6198361-Pleurochrysis_carterae.AAC.2
MLLLASATTRISSCSAFSRLPRCTCASRPKVYFVETSMPRLCQQTIFSIGHRHSAKSREEVLTHEFAHVTLAPLRTQLVFQVPSTAPQLTGPFDSHCRSRQP